MRLKLAPATLPPHPSSSLKTGLKSEFNNSKYVSVVYASVEDIIFIVYRPSDCGTSYVSIAKPGLLIALLM